MKFTNNINNAEDIKVNDIYGIYQNRCKAFWECKIANLKLKLNRLDLYCLKEINLETNEIINSYTLKDRNFIIDQDGNIHKIPIFNNDIQKNNNIIL
tara:strand:+ start:120 stop:410 length:291 start_codon:yes stop_codon:yes gene_type:complete